MNWLNLNMLQPRWLLPVPPDSTVAYIITQFRHFCGRARWLQLASAYLKLDAARRPPSPSVDSNDAVPSSESSYDKFWRKYDRELETKYGQLKPGRFLIIVAGQWPRPLKFAATAQAAGDWCPSRWWLGQLYCSYLFGRTQVLQSKLHEFHRASNV